MALYTHGRLHFTHSRSARSIGVHKVAEVGTSVDFSAFHFCWSVGEGGGRSGRLDSGFRVFGYVGIFPSFLSIMRVFFLDFHTC